jgi:hypothetical protein
METDDPKAKIGDFIKSKILKFELMILAIVVFILILEFLDMPLVGLIATLVLMTVSIFYFFSAFATPAGTGFSSIDLFFNKLIALSCSVAIIGILFLIQHWPNGKIMITIGLVSMMVCLAYIIYQKNKTPEIEIFSKFVLLRLIILIIVSAGVLYLGI